MDESIGTNLSFDRRRALRYALGMMAAVGADGNARYTVEISDSRSKP